LRCETVDFLDFYAVLWYNTCMKDAQNLAQIIAEKDQKIAELEQRNQWLLDQLLLFRHRQFGARSEKSTEIIGGHQLSLFNEVEAEAAVLVPEPKIKQVKAHYRKKSRLTTDRLPPDLPVEIIEHELPADEQHCPGCGESLHAMGREVREELKFVPAHAVIVRHIRHVYACRCCEKNSDRVPVIKAPIPAPVIKGSFASPNAVAHIAYEKFVMGTPLYRQEQDWNRKGIDLSRQTMSNWLIRATRDWLLPIYDELKNRLQKQQLLHADETTVQVLHEANKPAQSKSYMWLYRTSGDSKDTIVLYDYQPDRKHNRPQEFLGDFHGYLHTDGYDGYHKLQNITVVGCWAHARRKFDEAVKLLPEKARQTSQAMEGIRLIGQLYKLEKEFQNLSYKERFEMRQKHSKPFVDAFFNWCSGLDALPKTPLGKAAGYCLAQRLWLENFLLDGRLEIDNNRAERSIKPFVIGRKNWLFSKTPSGAKTSAVLYSIIETAKENGLNPFEYLTFVFRNAPNWDWKNKPDELERLLPFSATSTAT